MVNVPLIYLASPYSTPKDGITMQARFLLTELAAAYLINLRYAVWSPIVHCHKMAQKYTMPTDAQSWQVYNEAFISRCSEVWVLCIPGWDQSTGVRMEIDFANSRDIPLKYVIVSAGEPGKVRWTVHDQPPESVELPSSLLLLTL